MNTLAFGEVLWDVYSNSKHLGGATMNFAAHFKKCGGQSWIVTAVGNDEFGIKAIDEIKSLGIHTDFINVLNNVQTGKCLVTLDENKVPSYDLLNNVAYDEIQVPQTNNLNFDLLYFGTLALRNENNLNVINKIIKDNKFQDIFVDVNIRPPYYSKEVILFALNNATIIKISDEELSVVMETIGSTCSDDVECAQTLSKRFKNLKIVIITRGDKGSIVYDSKDKKTYEQKAKKVEVVSTVGAGDSFSAAFLYEYINSKDVRKALALATEISGFVVSKKDAIPKYEISDFLQR